MCTELGLEPEPAATQVVARDRHAEFFPPWPGRRLAERFATEIRHLQRSEVARPGAVPLRAEGSSAMPHKRNPIVSERMAGAAGCSGLRPGWPRERRPVARAGHLPFVGRAGCHPRRLPGTGLRPRHLYQRSSASRSTRRGWPPTWKRPGTRLQPVGAADIGRNGVEPRRRLPIGAEQRTAGLDRRRHIAELLAEDPEMDLSSGEQLAACFQQGRCWSIRR